MSRIAYVNGRYVPHGRASVHVEDRGYQFSDGVYEVVLVRRDRFVDEAPHLDRLWRSLGELRIGPPMSRAALRSVSRELVRRNRLSDGILYIQVTRGVAPRDHAFPAAARPALVMTVKPLARRHPESFEAGVSAITIPDIRWRRCDIKTVALLASVLGKQQARESGAYEAWMVDDDGFVTEGTSTNAWIVTGDGDLVTRKADNAILNGVTRRAVLVLARRNGLRLVERAFSVAEAKRAREAFVTSASSFVTPVVRIDDSVIGNGRAGSLAMQLVHAYEEYIDGAGAVA